MILYTQFSLINRYTKREVHNLARFISVMKFQPLSWRTNHPYVLSDRFEDVTPPERVHMNNKCDRNITLYGYLRGCNLKKETKVPLLWLMLLPFYRIYCLFMLLFRTLVLHFLIFNA